MQTFIKISVFINSKSVVTMISEIYRNLPPKLNYIKLYYIYYSDYKHYKLINMTMYIEGDIFHFICILNNYFFEYSELSIATPGVCNQYLDEE